MNKRVVVVTGASSGIGLACANRLHQRGWTVVGASRRMVANVAWESVSLDVDQDVSVAQGIAQVLAHHGQIDAVVACAGWGLAGPAETTSTADAKAQMETNFWGAVRVVKEVLPSMREHGGGRVVLMSSIGGLLGIPFQAFYSASKFAMEGYAEALAYEVEPFNVQVTLVEPGNFKTGFTASRRMSPSASEGAYEQACAKAVSVMEKDEVHGADPADVAKVVDRVLKASKAPRRMSVGKFDERIGLVAKRVMPFRWFERAAKGSLGV